MVFGSIGRAAGRGSQLIVVREKYFGKKSPGLLKKTERAPNWTIQNWLEKSANSTKNTSKRISTSQHFNNR